MTSKSKGQLLLRTDHRGEQRHQLSAVADIRDNTTHKRSLSQPKLLHPGSRTNNSLDIGLEQSHMSTSTPIIPTGAQQPKAVKMSQNRFITSVSTLQQRERLPSGSLDVTVGVDDSRNNNKRSFSVKDSASSSMCRDFLRNVCKRGSKCRFLHPKPFSSDTENSRPDKRIRQHEETNNSYNNTNDTAASAVGDRNGHKDSTVKDKALGGNSMQLKVMFCHDHQNRNTECERGTTCRFIHCTRLEEEEYRRSGYLPPHIRDQAINKGISCDLPALFGARPICKDHLKNQCKRKSNCRFRHLTPMQYDLEITRCIQSSAERQQHQEQQENVILDEREEQLKQQQQEMSHVRMQHLQCPETGSEQMSLSLNTGTRDLSHSYLNSNADGGNAHFNASGCEHSESWGASQNTPGNYVDFLGAHDVAVKRCRFDQGKNFAAIKKLAQVLKFDMALMKKALRSLSENT